MFPLLFSFSFFCFQLMSSIQSKSLSPIHTIQSDMGFNKYMVIPNYTPMCPPSTRESDKHPSAIQKNTEVSGPQNQDNKQLPKQKDSMDLTVSVHFETKGDGEHVMKIKGFNPSSTKEDNVERAKQMAHQKAAVLLLYGEMLQEMGKQWRAQCQASNSNE